MILQYLLLNFFISKVIEEFVNKRQFLGMSNMIEY